MNSLRTTEHKGKVTPLMNYRREIDGLRALAVLPVIFFHAGFDTFSGGFVGVDVFFVISGYLITSIILAEKQAGTFSLIHFYERRARRILPALFFVMAVSIPFAWLWLLPHDMKGFSRSLAAIAAFASNILFLRESGYFDAPAEVKPLLHTWSLAVEEQFYALFPLFLMLTWRLGKRWIVGLLIVFGAISLAVAHWGAFNKPAATFFLLPTRGWELMIGAFIAFYFAQPNRINISQQVSQSISIVGLLLILYAVFAFSQRTPFPSLYALVPTIGAALIILFTTPTTFVGKVLGSKAFLAIGLISYSAYLWHQPLFAFARQRSLTEPSAVFLSFLSVAAFVLAYFSWRFVEQPFRRRDHIRGRTVFLFAVFGTLLFLGIGLFGNAKDGFPQRFKRITEKFSGYEIDNEKLRQESWKILRSLSNDEEYAVVDDLYNQSARFSINTNSTKVLIIGNSHSKDLFNLFAQNQKLFPQFEFARYGVHVACLGDAARATFFRAPAYKSADVILVSTRWTESRCSGVENSRDDFYGIETLVRVAKRDGKLVVLTSNTLEFPQSGSYTIADKFVFRASSSDLNNSSRSDRESLVFAINRYYFEVKHKVKHVRIINERIREFATRNQLIYLDKQDFLCDETSQLCFGISSNLHKRFFDYGHYTLEGAKEFGVRASLIGWLRPIEEVIRYRKQGG